ncbi:MAG TPA: A/G-specific adenine glycosylase [Polyangiaceae bacterium]|nr:A/G-specific adenine glycosylase [Polyangiaceae bacterium]
MNTPLAPHDWHPNTLRAMRHELLTWFEKYGRQLPWRTKPRDPYAVWVSEIMLQQTRVATVVPYFERFMHRFPTLEALACAPVDDVLSAWSGLGYYRRARALHATARQVMQQQGRLPSDHAHLLRLSGIGYYTAAAIASIAFDIPVAVVDGNVIRVLTRLTNDASSMDSTTARNDIHQLANQLIDPKRPGAYNEAIMELGALLCTPRTPSCAHCPWRKRCLGLHAQTADQLPVLAKRKPSALLALEAFVITDNQQRVLLCRRHPRGLYGGLWEPPMSAEGPQATRMVESWIGKKGQRLQPRLTHVLTHRVLSIRVTRWALDSAEAPKNLLFTNTYDRMVWLSETAMAERGISSLAMKVLAFSRRAT